MMFLYASALASWPVAKIVVVRLLPYSVPVGILTFWLRMAATTSSMPMPRAVRRSGFTCTRTAYFCAPPITTCATPVTMENCRANKVSPYSCNL